VVFEFRILGADEVEGGGKPNRVNSRVRAFFKLSRTRSGDLTEDGERWMARLKTLLANILGGEDREEGPVTDEDVTPLIAAGIVKGTEYKVNDIDPSKLDEVVLSIATKDPKDGGLGISAAEAKDLIADGDLILADVRGMCLLCEAKLNGKGNFTNLYWQPYFDEGEDAAEAAE
jgi:hypothetical protein